MTNPLGTGGFEPRTSPAERRDFFDVRRNQQTIIKWLQDNFIGGLIILGRVANEAALPLPPPPNRPGDGYLTDDPLDHLWVWVDDPNDQPPRWIDTGLFNVTDHDALQNVTIDQHHNKSHTHDGDGSGPIAHSTTTGQTVNDHHAQVHGHTGADGSGTVAHSDTTGITTDDHHAIAHNHDGIDGSSTVAHSDTTGLTTDNHHNQVHLLYGTDHSDVDNLPVLAERHLLAQPPAIDGWTPEYRMNWRAGWIPGPIYYRHDVVTDGVYAMVANKETTDQPAPVPTGIPAWTVPDIPTWNNNTHTGNVFSGVRVQPPAGRLFEIQKVRVWLADVSPNAHYRAVVYDAITGLTTLGAPFDGDVLSAPGWLEVVVDATFVAGGDDFFFLLQASNSAGTTDFNHPWVRGGNTNTDADPGAGNWNQNNNVTSVRMNAFDDDGANRTNELQSVVIGTNLRFAEEGDLQAYLEYEVTSIIDNTTWFQFGITLLDTGGNGAPGVGTRDQAYFEIPLAAPTAYGNIVDHYLPNPDLSGYVSLDSLTGGTENEDAHNADVQFQEYTVSPDWDLLSTSGGSGGGGGGEGVNPLPIGGTTDQALTKIDGTDFNVQWSGPFWDFTDLEAGTVDDQMLQWDNAGQRWYATAQATFLRIIGSVADFASLPPGPHTHGDAWITNDTGHLWMWSTVEVPDAFVDLGPYNVTNHDGLSGVTADQHHPQLHNIDSHTDVDTTTDPPLDRQRLAWDSQLGLWVPKTSTSAAGFVQFPYRVLTTPTATPNVGNISGNDLDVTLVTIVYMHKVTDAGEDVTLFLENLSPGDWINVHEDDDYDNHRSYDVAAHPTQVGDVFHIPVTFYAQLGAPLSNNEKVGVLLRYTGVTGSGGPHVIDGDSQAPPVELENWQLLYDSSGAGSFHVLEGDPQNPPAELEIGQLLHEVV